MTLSTTNEMGRKARDFALKGIDGKTYSLSHVRGPKGTLVVFICNHCPLREGVHRPDHGRG
jgi:hypothetical protein